jgi:hypothetical protein
MARSKSKHTRKKMILQIKAKQRAKRQKAARKATTAKKRCGGFPGMTGNNHGAPWGPVCFGAPSVARGREAEVRRTAARDVVAVSEAASARSPGPPSAPPLPP